MSEININNPPPESPERNSSLGMGIILGVILAIVIVIAIVMFTVSTHPSSSSGAAPQNSAPSINVNVPSQQPGSSAGATKPAAPAPGSGNSAPPSSVSGASGQPSSTGR